MMEIAKPAAALLLGLAAFVATSSAEICAQEFRLEEATSLAALAVDGLNPKTIAFLDRPSEELVDLDTRLVRFEDWAQARPVEKQFLSPFPSYVEPYVEVTVEGVRKRIKEKLHMYVAEARFGDRRKPHDAPVLLCDPDVVVGRDDLGDELPTLLVGVEVRQERQQRLEGRRERRSDLVGVFRRCTSDHGRTLRACRGTRASPSA